MPRKFDGPVDLELLREYLIPALRVVADMNRNPRCPTYDGVAKPGRAIAVDLAADWLEDLMAREAEFRSILASPIGRRRPVGAAAAADDADAWLDAMERDTDKVTNRMNGYRCPDCGVEIESGEKIGAGIRGIVHARCPV